MIEENKRDQLAEKMIHAIQQADGLRSLFVSEGHIMSPGGPPPYAKVIEASFDSLEDFMAWVQSSAAQEDKEEIMSNMVGIYYEVKEL
jgi:heme-degrading monooxygenase HmoA